MINQSIVIAAQRLLVAFAEQNAEAVTREVGLIARMHIEGQRHNSAQPFPVSFDGWDLVVVGEYNEGGFDLEAAYLPDSAVDATDLFDARELELFMVTLAEVEAKQTAAEMIHEREVAAARWEKAA